MGYWVVIFFFYYGLWFFLGDGNGGGVFANNNNKKKKTGFLDSVKLEYALKIVWEFWTFNEKFPGKIWIGFD